MLKTILTICLIFFCLPCVCQQIITGHITDYQENKLPGVSVYLKEDKSIATITDTDGYYKLIVPNRMNECTIQASFIGYVPQEKKITNQTERINLKLMEKEVDLDMVVVTATRTPKLLKDAPIVTKVFTEKDLKKVDATNIGELLQSELPGIEFSYSMNQQVSLNMQGFGGNSVLFLIDGERVAGETLDNVDYSRLNLDNVERVEIIKGAASSLYGSNAVGGVVNIITKKTSDAWMANINTRYGSHNDWRLGGGFSFSTKKINSFTNVQHTSIDAINLKNEGDYSKIYANKTWNIKERLHYDLNNKIKLIGRAGYFFKERNSQELIRDHYRSYSGGLKGNYDIDKRKNIELAYSFDQYDKSNYLIESRKDIKNYSNVQHSIKTIFNWSFDEKKTLSVGGGYMRDYLTSYQFVDNRSYRQYIADAFGQYDWRLTNNFSLIAGLRYDYFSESSIHRISPKVSLMYKLNKFALRGSYANGFRSPTLKEMYMNFDMANIFMIYGNPNLKSESSHNFTLSGEYTNKNINLSSTLYYNHINNQITTVWDQALKGMVYSNTNKINITGIDINASTRLACGIGVRLSYIYTYEYTPDDSPIVSTTRPHTATTRIDYEKLFNNYGFILSLNGRFLSKVNTHEYTTTTSDYEVQKVSYPEYMIWKLSLLQHIGKGIDLTLAVDNLFNYIPSYYYNNSPTTTGTSFSVGLSINMEKFFK